jgi:hypothetical protein
MGILKDTREGRFLSWGKIKSIISLPPDFYLNFSLPGEHRPASVSADDFLDKRYHSLVNARI